MNLTNIDTPLELLAILLAALFSGGFVAIFRAFGEIGKLRSEAYATKTAADASAKRTDVEAQAVQIDALGKDNSRLREELRLHDTDRDRMEKQIDDMRASFERRIADLRESYERRITELQTEVDRLRKLMLGYGIDPDCAPAAGEAKAAPARPEAKRPPRKNA